MFNQKAVADYSDKRDESLVAVRIFKVKRLIDFRVWRDRAEVSKGVSIGKRPNDEGHSKEGDKSDDETQDRDT